MERILNNNLTYSYYEYPSEKEFEQVIVQQAPHIFGSQSIYIDIKKRIGDSIITIPDGYLIDFSFEQEPRLYIIENELSSHDPYKHIGSQLLKFAISYKASGRKIKAFLLEHLMADKSILAKAEKGLKAAGYRNIDDFLESIIFEKTVAAIVVIDQATPELENVLSQLTMDTDILEFQTFINKTERIHKFTPFNADIRELTESSKSDIKAEDLNTVVVAAREEGFEQEFLKNNCWYSIRIHASMLDKIKYIAAYQVAPVSAITYYAEISKIEKWNDTNKYILYFKDKAIKIKAIPLDKNKKGLAPQAPRYTSIDRLLKAKSLADVF
ncbi:MAG: hypothetical protein HZA79_04510 [Sphingobacteriales bacterium]|nr:hypothetical protein [Sphingobacteriales bacterium]